MLGTANFDIRSFYLNFEVNLLSYDEDLNGRLRSYQTTCIQQSKELDRETWRSRGKLRQWGRNSPSCSVRSFKDPRASRDSGIQTEPSESSSGRRGEVVIRAGIVAVQNGRPGRP